MKTRAKSEPKQKPSLWTDADKELFAVWDLPVKPLIVQPLSMSKRTSGSTRNHRHRHRRRKRQEAKRLRHQEDAKLLGLDGVDDDENKMPTEQKLQPSTVSSLWDMVSVLAVPLIPVAATGGNRFTTQRATEKSARTNTPDTRNAEATSAKTVTSGTRNTEQKRTKTVTSETQTATKRSTKTDTTRFIRVVRCLKFSDYPGSRRFSTGPISKRYKKQRKSWRSRRCNIPRLPKESEILGEPILDKEPPSALDARITSAVESAKRCAQTLWRSQRDAIMSVLTRFVPLSFVCTLCTKTSLGTLSPLQGQHGQALTESDSVVPSSSLPVVSPTSSHSVGSVELAYKPDARTVGQRLHKFAHTEWTVSDGALSPSVDIICQGDVLPPPPVGSVELACKPDVRTVAQRPHKFAHAEWTVSGGALSPSVGVICQGDVLPPGGGGRHLTWERKSNSVEQGIRKSESRVW